MKLMTKKRHRAANQGLYTRAAMGNIEHDLGRQIGWAVVSARKNPGVAHVIGIAPKRGMNQVLMKRTHCSGVGPYRWYQNATGCWFIEYDAL